MGIEVRLHILQLADISPNMIFEHGFLEKISIILKILSLKRRIIKLRRGRIFVISNYWFSCHGTKRWRVLN